MLTSRPNKSLTLTLKVPFQISDIEGVTSESIQLAFQSALTDWCDGRYPFDIETLQVSLQHCLRDALRKAVQESEGNKHGHATVPYHSADGKVIGKVANWFLTSEDLMRGAIVHIFSSEVKVEISD